MFHRQRGISNQAVVISIVVAIILAGLLYVIFSNSSGGTQTVNGTVDPQQLQPSTSAESQAEAEPETQPESNQENEPTELEQAEENTSAENQLTAEDQETAEPESETEPEQSEEDALAESEVTPEDGVASESESQEAAENRATLETPESAELESQEMVEQVQEETSSAPQEVPEQTQEETSSATLETSEQTQEDTPSATQATEQAQEDTPAEDYTIAGGDTLYSIARNHDTTVTALVEANAIADPHQIGVGQVVTIPAQQTNQGEASNRTYTVKSKDTLYSIAKRYATSVDAMADVNGIADSGVIKVGQVLRMPLDASPVPK